MGMSQQVKSSDSLTARLTNQLNSNNPNQILSEHQQKERPRSSFCATWSDIPLKFQSLIIIMSIIILSIGYYINLILCLLITAILSILTLFIWFSATDLSVEITVFLAKFFPPSSQCVWNCIKT